MSTEERDWFAPRNTGPRDGAGRTPPPPPAATPPPWQARSRTPYPDQQVWPPLSREGVTQPIPAVRDAAPPLPRPAVPPTAPPPPPPPPVPVPVPEAVQEPPPPAREAAPRRRGRAALVAAGAVVSVLAAVAVHTVDGYLFYEQVSTQQDTREVVVPAGQVGKVHDIEWKATVSRTKAPAGSRHGADVAWMKIEIIQKVLSDGSATMTGMPDDLRLHDRAGRSWAVELGAGDRPSDRLEVGQEYALAGLAVVPVAVADQVELAFTPSAYRSDTPTKDLFKRPTTPQPPRTTLRFRR
ncbi:MAG: hypothetical protein K0R62_1853 [Nonomuraea muscovyensis]|nr:hypothetical protein [Nonomuraea muscovyensis]